MVGETHLITLIDISVFRPELSILVLAFEVWMGGRSADVDLAPALADSASGQGGPLDFGRQRAKPVQMC